MNLNRLIKSVITLINFVIIILNFRFFDFKSISKKLVTGIIIFIYQILYIFLYIELFSKLKNLTFSSDYNNLYLLNFNWTIKT